MRFNVLLNGDGFYVSPSRIIILKKNENRIPRYVFVKSFTCVFL